MAETTSEGDEAASEGSGKPAGKGERGAKSAERSSGKGKDGKAGTAAKAGAAGGVVGFMKGRRGGKGKGGGAAKAVRSGMARLGRLVTAVFGALALIVIVAIILIVLGANRDNSIVATLIQAGDYLVGPFRQIFTFDNRSTEVAVNWGIAAAVYLIVGGVVGRILGRS